MGRAWTTEQVTALAPDPGSLKNGRGLASPRKWTLLGSDEDWVWGLCQGSGKDPYQVQIDLAEPAFKCSCPSRKFPCKHGLGLFFLFCEQRAALSQSQRPAWVEEWAAKRAEKAARKEEQAARPADAPSDPQAQAKRREKREAKIADGLDYLHGWLEDLVRRGFGAAQGAGYAFWEEPARRMVDAQAPGLARQVRMLGAACDGTDGWEARLFDGAGRLYLLLEAYRRRAACPPELVDEINALAGWTADQSDLLSQSGQRDHWLAIAQTVEEEDNLVTRSTYLAGRSGRLALLLQFSHPRQVVADAVPLGRWFDAELVFFPGIEPLRALLKGTPQTLDGWCEPPIHSAWDAMLNEYARVLQANPWRMEQPFLARLTPVRRGADLLAVDSAGRAAAIHPKFRLSWELLAMSGGSAIDLLGLWNGSAFRPLSVISDHRVFMLTGGAA